MATKHLKSWSYSTYNRWKGCARAVYFQKIKKLPDPIGKAGQRGIMLHEVAENFVKGTLEELPTSGPAKILHHFRTDLTAARESPTATAELDFAFTKAWSPTRWNDWANCWVRMKVDLFDMPDPEHAVITDYKSGRRRDYTEQLELYAVGGFAKYPKLEEVTAEIWYLDEGDEDDAIEGITILRSEYQALRDGWDAKVAPMLEDERWRASPGHNCGWCAFSSKKGGPCESG